MLSTGHLPVNYLREGVFAVCMYEKGLIVFQGNNIRRTWFNDEWWFVAVDVIGALTGSKDPAGYLKDMRRRDEGFSQGWGQIATPLKIDTPGGKQQINCVSVKGAFRLIQSVPSPKVEPFKLWLAKVGYERVQEIENPELAQDRAKMYYEEKGYPKEWIEKRLRGIAIRQDLTKEWSERGIKEQRDFDILTNEIAKATFGKTIKEHKEIKGLDNKNKNQNLRDHMNDLELIFNMLGEASTTAITKSRDSEGMKECKKDSKDGGKIAGNARLELEKKTGEKVVSSDNYLGLKKKRLK